MACWAVRAAFCGSQDDSDDDTPLRSLRYQPLLEQPEAPVPLQFQHKHESPPAEVNLPPLEQMDVSASTTAVAAPLRRGGGKSEWTATEADANGDVLWRHPSGAEQVLSSTMSTGARRQALSRAHRAHVAPSAADRARNADAQAKATKRATDTVWREREREADAKVKAQKRVNDPEWRALVSPALCVGRFSVCESDCVLVWAVQLFEYYVVY